MTERRPIEDDDRRVGYAIPPYSRLQFMTSTRPAPNRT